MIALPLAHACGIINFLCQQIRASDIWRESQHDDLQWVDHYHLKMKMRSSWSTIEFEGTTDDSQMKMKLEFGMKVVCTIIQIDLLFIYIIDSEMKKSTTSVRPTY